MEEDKYRSTYNELTPVRCVFEKTLTNHQAKCLKARHFCLADREGYACSDKASADKCRKFLEKLREKSIFVLKLREINGPLPHNMEIRVQAGGVKGLSRLETPESGSGSNDAEVSEDINALLDRSIEKFGSLDDFPYSEIIQSVVKFQGRRRRQRK
ncbi:MAG: hypothetical protein IMF14_01335 [Proteobacteria bacterium]|nr:hypothetical protein [Pseudomonadota bacterium]